MPRRGRGRGRHGGGRGRLPVPLQPRPLLPEDETSQTRAAGQRMVASGPSSPPAVLSAPAEHDPYRNRPSRGGAGGRTVPPPSRPGAEPVPCQDNVPLPPAALPDVSYLDVLLGNTTLKESSAAATSSSVAAISSPILVRKPDDWYFTFYIREDLGGSFHTYPDLSGPFKSLQEADNAINRHLHDLEDPKMSDEALDKLSIMERAIQESLYWPDGTRKKCFEPPDKTEDEVHLLVQALVDQYNEDHKLLGDHALQLKDVQRQRFFFTKGDQYYHFNFTAITEGVVDSFFAEVRRTQGEHEEMVVCCFCVVKPYDNGCCYGCQNNGAVGMKHPNKADAYCRGRVDEYMPCLGGYHIEQSFLTESVEEEKARLRYQYECLDDPSFMAKHFPNCVKRTVKI